MSESLLVKAYSIPHSLDIKDFVDNYMCLLNSVLDDLWRKIEWKRKGKRLIPLIRKDSAFKKELRDKHLREWIYSKHYVDSAIKQAYSVLNSWRRRYLKGKAGRRKPLLKRRFVRVKETLYSYREGVVKISIKPFQESISIDLKEAWFWDRIRGLELGELILKEDGLIITVRKKIELKVEKPVA